MEEEELYESTEYKDVDFSKDKENLLTSNETAMSYTGPYSGGTDSAGSSGSPDSFPPVASVAIPESITDKGARAVFSAKQDVGKADARNGANKGRKGFTPAEMWKKIMNYTVKISDNGYYSTPAWCACAVSSWWKDAGLEIPDYGPDTRGNKSNGASYVPRWVYWAIKRGKWSQTPCVGAAVVFNGHEPHEHIGIVESIAADGSLSMIEGNYSNYCARTYTKGASKVRDRSIQRIAGFIIPG